MQSIRPRKEITEQEATSRLEALCSRAEHCAFEMQEKMKRWGLDEAAQLRVIALLRKNRYIDDERFAMAFARDKIVYNKWGRRKVDQALRMKRIDEDVRTRVLDSFDKDDFTDSLRPLLIAKMKATKAKNDYELGCKLIRFALGRGFEYEDIKNCLAEMKLETEEY